MSDYFVICKATAGLIDEALIGVLSFSLSSCYCYGSERDIVMKFSSFHLTGTPGCAGPGGTAGVGSESERSGNSTAV